MGILWTPRVLYSVMCVLTKVYGDFVVTLYTVHNRYRVNVRAESNTQTVSGPKIGQILRILLSMLTSLGSQSGFIHSVTKTGK